MDGGNDFVLVVSSPLLGSHAKGMTNANADRDTESPSFRPSLMHDDDH